MDRDFLIQLTNNLYRLTLLFPKKEPLRYKMREIADEILVKPTEKNLEIINSFFGIAKEQNWISPSEILAIQQEYDNLSGELKEKKQPDVIKEKKGYPIAETDYQETLPERQEKILAFLRENGRAQVWQVKQILPEVTKRTLRRDFDQMLRQGLVERTGERNSTFYQPCRKIEQLKTIQS